MKTLAHQNQDGILCKLLTLSLGLSLLLSLEASADRAFILPSMTLNSGNAPLVTFDAASAESVFNFDHNTLAIDTLIVTAADGSQVLPESIALGKLRNSFDVRASQIGTYRIGIFNDLLIASYKVDGQTKRWRGASDAFANAIEREIPKDAQELQVIQAQSRIETFITNSKPTRTALQLTGKGLEIEYLTHPNDLVEGEIAELRLLIDGKPAPKLKVTVIADGARYRQNLEEEIFQSNEEGKLSIRWKKAGLFWLEARTKDKQVVNPVAQERRLVYAVTLEVMPL